MSKGGQSKDVFDVERIRQIIKLMEQHDLSEVDLQQGDEKIKLNRGAISPIGTAPAPVAVPQTAGSANPPVTDALPTDGTITINSPMVGTFYCRATPQSQPFVKIGDSINDESIVCIVEAMKVFSEIPAECSGKIVEILVSDQEPVDFGKPMFRVQPTK